MANYYGANKTLQYIDGKRIHWSGGRSEPPPDTPTCGFDGSLCPDNCKSFASRFITSRYYVKEIHRSDFVKVSDA